MPLIWSINAEKYCNEMAKYQQPQRSKRTFNWLLDKTMLPNKSLMVLNVLLHSASCNVFKFAI